MTKTLFKYNNLFFQWGFKLRTSFDYIYLNVEIFDARNQFSQLKIPTIPVPRSQPTLQAIALSRRLASCKSKAPTTPPRPGERERQRETPASRSAGGDGGVGVSGAAAGRGGAAAPTGGGGRVARAAAVGDQVRLRGDPAQRRGARRLRDHVRVPPQLAPHRRRQGTRPTTPSRMPLACGFVSFILVLDLDLGR